MNATGGQGTGRWGWSHAPQARRFVRFAAALGISAVSSAADATSATSTASATLAELNSVQAVLALPPATAVNGAPVRLNGRVIHADGARNRIVLQDASGAMPVEVDLQKNPVAGGDWVTLEGKTAARLTRYPDFPSGSQPLVAFEAPRTIGTRYMARVSGFLHPPRTGEYTFWIAGDNYVELSLSADDRRANLKKISGLPDLFDYTAFRQWEKFPTQRSAKILLQAGQKYFIEALHWEEEGEDSLSVAWAGPDLSRRVITGEFLSPPVGRGAEPGVGERGTILREFWLNYPILPPGPDTGGIDHATPFRNMSATIQSMLKPPPTHHAPAGIVVARATVVPGQPLPSPRSIRPGEAWSSASDYEWVETEGLVVQLANDGAFWTVLELEVETERLAVRIANPSQENWERLLQARVQVRGFCAGAFNERGARVASTLWVPNLMHVSVLPPRADDWERLPVHALSDLHSAKASFRPGQRVRLKGRLLENEPGRPLMVRDGVSQFSGFVSPDGITWTRITEPVAIPMNHSVHVGVTVVAMGDNLGTAVFDNLTIPLVPGTGVTVGAPPVAGSSRIDGDRFVLQGSGNNVRAGGGETGGDDLHFVSQRWEGDGEVVGRLVSLTVAEGTPFPGACAGLMVRSGLERDAKLAWVCIASSGGTQFRLRRENANPMESFASGHAEPYWLKLVRQSPPPLAVYAAAGPALARDDTIELLGVLERTGSMWTLRDAFYRPVSYEADLARAATERRAEITTVQQIRHLDAPALAQERPARVRGVVTAKTTELYVQDHTGGIRVPASAWQKFVDCEVGQFVEVNGRCVGGAYSPGLEPVQYDNLVILGAGRMPEPLVRTWNQLMEGRDDAQWVEVKGVVRRIENRMLKLQMASGTQLLELTFDLPPAHARRLIDATVRIQGVCRVLANEKKQLVGTRLIVPAAEFVIVEEPAATDPFSAAAQPVAGLLQFRDEDHVAHRAKATGVVTAMRDGFFYLEDATGGVKVDAAERGDLSVGDRAEVVGFSDSSGFSVNLIDAIARSLGRGTLPPPLKLRENEMPGPTHSSRLIEVTATFLGRSALLGNEVFQFQRGDRVFQASLPKNRGAVSEWESGTIVSLTGVCALVGDAAGAYSPENLEFEVLLNAPRDLVVVKEPDWWNLRRLLWVGGAFVGVLSVAAIWIAMMLRKNRLLSGAQAQLQEANDRLEARVMERTADLGRANTELSREQALLRALLDNSPDQIYFKDRESRFLKTGRAQARNFGVASAEELIGKTDFDYFDDQHAGPAFADEQEIIRTGNPIIGKIEKEVGKNGDVHWMLTSKLPLRNEAGEIVGTFGVSKDITAIKTAETELANVHKQLLETSRQAGMAEVATSVLHNVGNVLNSVNVSATLVLEEIGRSKVRNVAKVADLLREHADDLAEFLARDPKGQKVPGYLMALAPMLAAEQKAITEEINHLRRNVEHIKEVVAMQQNYAKVSGVTETVAIASVVEEAVQINAAAMARREIELVRDYTTEMEVVIDRHKVLQILVNLVSNAMNACDDSDREGKRVTVKVTQEDRRVRIAVIDTGVGILPENLTRIFAHGFTTRKNGHGFGLHSCALAAKELGGRLEVTSEGASKGATFVLELPIKQALQGAAATGTGSTRSGFE